MATKNTPDLILSDVMMPKLSGIELSKYLKNNESTSHLPIILLTAKSATESKVEGFESGADAYITKPFSQLELLAQINNLITQRIKLKELFRKELHLPPKDITTTSIDEKFLQKALKIVDDNLTNTAFNVSTFSEEFGASREHITRKLKGITGLTTTEFIRAHRLKKAATLLKGKTGNVSEVCYQVGFNDPAYFSRCFAEQFGVAPSKYAS